MTNKQCLYVIGQPHQQYESRFQLSCRLEALFIWLVIKQVFLTIIVFERRLGYIYSTYKYPARQRVGGG